MTDHDGTPDDLLARLNGVFDAALRLEHEAYAESLREEDERSQPFRARLLARRYGHPVRLHLLDGTVLAGRVTAVGIDWFVLREGARGSGVGAGRVHEVRVDAVSHLEVDGTA